jgi:vacuolar-type H+-ATPase subunit I/STV1
MAAMPASAREQFVGFMNKANGWFTVAGGAFLIALKETWELAELYELPIAIYVVAVVVLSVAAVANTVVRLVRADEMLHLDDPGYAEKKKAERADARGTRRQAPNAE